jgi:FMN-dependent NADH-azoreductase
LLFISLVNLNSSSYIFHNDHEISFIIITIYLRTLWTVIGKAKREIVRVDGREEKGSSRRWNKMGKEAMCADKRRAVSWEEIVM